MTETLETAWPLLLERDRLTHLSATQLTMFMRCKEQYRRRYLLGEKERPGAALVWGAADHKAHEHNFRQKIESHEDIPVGEIQEAFATAWEEVIEEKGGALEIEWGTEKAGELKDDGIRLVSVYHEQLSPLIQPLAVEREIMHMVEDVPVPVVGYVDVETEHSIIERKTSRRNVSAAKPEWVVQGLIYREVLQKPVEWHLSLKAGMVVTSRAAGKEALRLETGESAIDDLIRTVANDMLDTYRRYGPNEPWPGAITHPWSCSFCGWRPDCHWWKHERGGKAA
jgi:hypothetical protein